MPASHISRCVRPRRAAARPATPTGWPVRCRRARASLSPPRVPRCSRRLAVERQSDALPVAERAEAAGSEFYVSARLGCAGACPSNLARWSATRVLLRAVEVFRFRTSPEL